MPRTYFRLGKPHTHLNDELLQQPKEITMHAAKETLKSIVYQTQKLDFQTHVRADNEERGKG